MYIHPEAWQTFDGGRLSAACSETGETPAELSARLSADIGYPVYDIVF